MLAPWLIYATLLGALITVVALLVERTARWRGTPARWIWLAAIVAIIVTPVALSMRPHQVAPASEGVVVGGTAGSFTVAGLSERRGTSDRALLIMWLAVESRKENCRDGGTGWPPASATGDRGRECGDHRACCHGVRRAGAGSVGDGTGEGSCKEEPGVGARYQGRLCRRLLAV